MKEAEIVTVTKSVEEYVSYADALRRRLGDTPARKLSRFPRAGFAVQLLQRFRDRHGRLPDLANGAAERTLLKTVYDEYLQWHGLRDDVYSFADLEGAAAGARAELAPVAAIVGGALAQELLKAITGKELPFNNHFFFNGVTGTAQVELLS